STSARSAQSHRDRARRQRTCRRDGGRAADSEAARTCAQPARRSGNDRGMLLPGSRLMPSLKTRVLALTSLALSLAACTEKTTPDDPKRAVAHRTETIMVPEQLGGGVRTTQASLETPPATRRPTGRAVSHRLQPTHAYALPSSALPS